MKNYFRQVFGLATSATAKDTYTLFIGNLITAFLGFLTTLIIARTFSLEEFGIYSAVTNLIVIIASLTDLGLSSGLVGLAAKAFQEGDTKKAYQYSKAALLIKIYATLPLALICFIFAKYISTHWLATGDIRMSYWVGIISLVAVLWGFVPFILQAKKLFLKSVIIDISLSLPKAIIPYLLMLAGLLTVNTSMAVITFSVIIAGVVGLAFTGIEFLKEKPTKLIYKDLIKYSSWLGLNRIISSITGRLDIQMLAAMVGASATGQYSIPIKLASFLTILTASYASVIAPRMASMGSLHDEKKYLIKTTLATLPLVGGVLIWIIVAKPFIFLLFGQKYLPSVSVFQAIVASMIPFLLSISSTQAIIYSMKKTVFIGLFAIFQLPAMFITNYLLIGRYGIYGPAITFAILNTIWLILGWVIVIKHYWFEK